MPVLSYMTAGIVLGPTTLAVLVLFFFIGLEITPILSLASVIGISSLGVVAKILMECGKRRATRR